MLLTTDHYTIHFLIMLKLIPNNFNTACNKSNTDIIL